MKVGIFGKNPYDSVFNDVNMIVLALKIAGNTQAPGDRHTTKYRPIRAYNQKTGIWEISDTLTVPNSSIFLV